MGTTPSDKYRLMIYFAHSTLVLYQGSIHSTPEMTVGEFMECNSAVCKRVFAEGVTAFSYELSYEQMQRACAVYLKSKHFPQKVEGSLPYTLPESPN